MSVKRKSLIILIPLFLVFTLGFGFAATAKAVEFDEDGFIGANEVIDDDLFIGSETVEINGTVNGDVFAAGSVVKVNGTVNGSLVTGAQSVFVNGMIDGSVYAGSSTFTLGSEAEISRNLYYGGFNLSAEPGSIVKKDLLVGAYQVLLSGDIGRDVQAGVGALEIDGVVGNDVIAEVAGPSEGQQSYYFSSPPGVDTIIPSGIRISKDAKIGGSITYRSSEDQSDAIEISPAGGVTFEYNPDLDPEPVDLDEVGRVGSTALVGTWLLKRVRVFITMMLLGALIIWQMPGLLNRISDKVERESIPSLGWGMVSMMVVYLGAFLAAGLIIAGAIFFGVITLGELSRVILTIGFSSLGLIMAAFGLLVSYGSKLVVAYMIGTLIIRWLAPKYENQKFWSMLLGVLLYTFLRAIPVFGFAIAVFVTLIGIGAMWLAYRDRMLPVSSAEGTVGVPPIE
ncbi:MAG: polymer-forming cytoskeletal protein [Anaerolineales bacterium]